MPVVALSGSAVGAEKAQHGTVAQDGRVTGQLQAKQIAGRLGDVVAEISD